MASFGDRLRELRLERNLTQEELAANFGLHKTRISQYELNKRQADDEMKKKIAQFFNVSLDWLMGLTDIRNYVENSDTIIGVDAFLISEDKKQIYLQVKHCAEDFFKNDKINLKDKKEILDLMSKLYWEAESTNERKK